jgi:IclR family acetate operon transcriptional repressor
VIAGEGGAYEVGPRLLGMAAAALEAGADLRLARPVLADLRRRTGHVAFYAVRDAEETVYLLVSEPAQESWARISPGGRAPLRRGGPGLAILSALSGTETVTAGASAPGNVVPGAVRGQAGAGSPGVAVREAVVLGYALDDGFEEPDIRSVASPVHDGQGRVVGAIGIRGMAFTLDDESVALFGPLVRAAARTIGAGLGADAPRFGTAGARDGDLA